MTEAMSAILTYGFAELGLHRVEAIIDSANGSPAFGFYLWDAETGVYQLFGLMVLGVVDEQIADIVAYLEPKSFSSFALPSTLPSSSRQSIVDDDFPVSLPTRNESR
jgi:hypothetical protein